MEDNKEMIQENPEVEQTTAEEQTTEETQQEAPVRGMSKLRGRYKEKYPDENFDDMDDDAFEDRAMSDYDAMEGQLKDHQEHEKMLGDLFDKSPQSANFLMGMARGEDFLTNLQRNFGSDIVEAMSNPEKMEELKKANQEHLDRLAKSKQLMMSTMPTSRRPLQM